MTKKMFEFLLWILWNGNGEIYLSIYRSIWYWKKKKQLAAVTGEQAERGTPRKFQVQNNYLTD